jgi:cytochrome c5
LAQAGLEDDGQRRHLAAPESLRAGRDVLRRKCVRCHDLRTALARPRTPENWRSTVRRMADRTTLLDPIDEDEQWQVTAYLIAISPQLQKSAQKMRAEQERSALSILAAGAVAAGSAEPAAFDPAKAKKLFETKCSQCHSLKLVEMLSPSTEAEVRTLVTRMVAEGLSATEEELEQIVGHLAATFAAESKE